MFRNLIFDWSGTLCNDLPPVVETVNRILTHHGLVEMDEATFLNEFQLPFGEFYKQRLPQVGFDELERLYNEFFPASAKEALPIPHAMEFIATQHARRCRCFALSAVTPAHFQKQAAALNCLDFFEKTYLGVRDKRLVIHSILEENKLKPEETCFIGDMCHDVDAAKHAGITSIAVLTGYDSAAKLAASRPDVMVADLRQLNDWFERMDPLRSMPVSTVGALIFNPDQKLLLVKTRKWSGKWGIAGGKIKRGESAEAALRRETREETGLAIENIQFILVQDCVEPEEFERPAHFILLNYLARTAASDVILNEEAQEYRWVSIDEALKMELNSPTRVLIQHVVQSLYRKAVSEV